MMLSLLVVLATFSASAASLPEELPQASPEEVLEYEVHKLKAEKVSLEGDKQALLATVQGMIRTNQTKVLQQQVSEMSSLKTSVEERCAHERSHLQLEAKKGWAEAKKAEAVIAAAKADFKEMEQQGADLVNKLRNMQWELAEAQGKVKSLTYDKKHLMETMQGVLRQNEQYARKIKLHERKRLHRKRRGKTAAKKLRNALRGLAAEDVQHEQGSVEEHEQEDPTAYMGESGDLGAYIAKFKAKAFLRDNGIRDEAPSAGPSLLQGHVAKGDALLQWLNSS